MIIIFFFMLLGLGAYFAYKFIAPEFNIRFDPQLIRLPWRRFRLKDDIVRSIPSSSAVVEEDLAEVVTEQIEGDVSDDDQRERLERILQEKNSEIAHLSKALAAERQHRVQFEKTQDLLQEEILRLKQDVKQLKKQGVS